MNDLFSTLYNFMSSFYSMEWDNLLYDEGGYSYLGLSSLIIPIIVSFIFYFLPTVALHGKGKWFLFLGIAFLLNLLCGYLIGDSYYNSATDAQIEGVSGGDEFGTAFVGSIYGIVWFFASSLIMMLPSTNNKMVPFN